MSFTATLDALPALKTSVIPTEEIINQMVGADGQRLARQYLAQYDILYAIRTHSRYDVGGWTGEARLPPLPTFFLPPRQWAFITSKGLLVTAWLAHFRTPKPLCQLIGYQEILHAAYNYQREHLSLAVSPEIAKVNADERSYISLRMEPLAGLQFLAHITNAHEVAVQ